MTSDLGRKFSLISFVSLIMILTSIFAATSDRVLTRGYFRIVHAVEDSAYCAQVSAVLNSALQEVTQDLQLPPPDTMMVYLAPDRRAFLGFSRGQLPRWAQAFAIPTRQLMVLKSPRWDRSEGDGSATAAHELVHLLLHKKTRGRKIPRWLDEGLAIFYSGEKRWQTATAISKGTVTDSLIPLDQIDWVLDFHRSKAELAYQQSYSAVHYLLRWYDIEAVRIILDGIREGRDLDESFQLATGSTFAEFEREWTAYAQKAYQWLWLSEFDDLLWIPILLLTFAVFVILRLRNRRRIREWEELSEAE